MNPDLKANEAPEFLMRRLTEDCPFWAIGIPVLFALAVLGLIVFFRPQHKLIAGIVGLAIVGLVSIFYLPLAFILRPLEIFPGVRLGWLVILIPVMAVAFLYVCMMYVRDSKSVHPLWAIFLGILRTSVYCILALVFLLPGCQHYEKQEFESGTVFLFDVSGSMFTVDGIPEEGKDPKLLPSRQDLIFTWLNGMEDPSGRQKQTTFMDSVLKKTPVTAYRFGAAVDETDILHLNLKQERNINADAWRKWLKPNKKDIPEPDFAAIKDDKARKEKEDEFHRRQDMVETLLAGTNIGGAALQVHKLENNSFLQAIVIVSDGKSNLGSEDSRMDFINRVNNPKRKIPVITVGVGQFRLPASIRIEDLQAPEETRPDDKFPVRVPVTGTNLHGEDFEVTLEAKRVKDVTGKPVEEKAFELGPKTGKFKAESGGDHPRDVVEFVIDVSDLKGIPVAKDTLGELEGEWHFTARVPRNKKEASFTDKEHISEIVKVQVQKRALRVLLFTSGATREYQFVRTILYREMLEKRMEVCIYNQQNAKEDFIDESVEPERVLADFPTRIEPNPSQKYMSLSDYDVVVCFDPDWTRLTVSQRNNLNKWVANDGGGVIFVAGPLYSYQIARPGGHDLESLLKIFPVVLKDNRLHGLPGSVGGHDTSRPYALSFTPNVANYDFLRLEEDEPDPLYAWNLFFWKNANFKANPAPDLRPYRGFYTYYPVERIKPATITIAALVVGKNEQIGDKSDAFKDQIPFIATMPYGSGKTMYLGSGEFWRLRSFKEGYHERFWIKLARFTAAGARERKKYGAFYMARNVPVGQIQCEAQVKGANFQWLPQDMRPTVIVKRIDKDRDEKAPLKQFDMKAKPGDGEWQGYFIGSIQIKEPGEYEFQLPIPGTTESLRQSILVRKSNPELDNVRTDFGYLYQMASEAGPLLANLPPAARKKVDAMMQVPQGAVVGEKPAKRLFFPVESADAVADCLVAVQPKTETVKGRFEDLWDSPVEWPGDMPEYIFWIAAIVPVAVSLLAALVVLLLGSWQGALGAVALGVLIGMVPVSIRYLTGMWVDLFWAVVLGPLIVGVIGTAILLVMRQWLAAVGFFIAAGMLSVLAFVYVLEPRLAVIAGGGLVTVAALGYGLYLGIAKQEILAMVSLIVLALGVDILGGYLLVQCTEEMARFAKIVSEDWLPIGFSGLLIVIVSLLGLEWLTRKLLRLA